MYIINSVSLFFLLLCLLLFSSCSIFNTNNSVPANVEREFTGVFVQGAEDTWFYSCEFDKSGWKPVMNEEQWDELYAFRAENGTHTMLLQVWGILSKKGDYRGFWQIYERELEILEIIEIDYADDTDC